MAKIKLIWLLQRCTLRQGLANERIAFMLKLNCQIKWLDKIKWWALAKTQECTHYSHGKLVQEKCLNLIFALKVSTNSVIFRVNMYMVATRV